MSALGRFRGVAPMADVVRAAPHQASESVDHSRASKYSRVEGLDYE
jgi:hypothetical protein